MRHSQKKETREKVDKLLHQYAEYNEATTEADKDRIGDEMTYADPIVWMMYKQEAYAGTDHAINTLGDLKKHSTDHGGICAKRMDFLSRFIKENYGKDILNATEFSNHMKLEDFYDSDIMNEIISSGDFMKKWETYEFFKRNSVVAKWENYEDVSSVQL